VIRIGTQAKELIVPAALAVVAVGALFGASALFFGLAIRKRQNRSFVHRLRAAFPTEPARPSFARIIAERGLATLAGIVATELGRVLSKNVLDGRYPDGRLVLAAHRDRNEIRVR
jgi:hypothetical protein